MAALEWLCEHWALPMGPGVKHQRCICEVPPRSLEATGSPEIVEEKGWGERGQGHWMRWSHDSVIFHFMVNVTPSVIINCSGLKKFGLHLGLVELSDMVIKKSIE